MIRFPRRRVWDKNKILCEIENYNYISFDVFDTLIKRNVPFPQSVFMLVEREACKKYGDGLSGFAVNRKKAETDARRTCSGEEISFADIYQQLGNYYSEEKIIWLQKKELDLEYMVCIRNHELYEVYRSCLRSGKKIIITSDMYLPEDSIKRMLVKCGIEKWDYLFLSSETGLTKASGNMYGYILDTLKIDPDSMLHLGDNRISDVRKPREYGIASLYAASGYSNVRYPGTATYGISDECAKAFIKNTISEIKAPMKLGYECFGPLLFGFTVWLMKDIQDNGIRDVYFLSRDGYILKEAFDILNDDKEKISSHYLYASRRAFRIPMLANGLAYEEFIRRIFWGETVFIKDFIGLLGIEDPDEAGFYLKEKQDYCINKKELGDDEVFKKIYYEITGRIRSKATEEKEALLRYMCEERIGENKTAVVDIGWHGNMQLNLTELLSEGTAESDICGYYIGVDPYHNHKERIRMKGFLFDKGVNEDLYCREFDASMHNLLEQVFMAPHGSVKSFKLEHGMVDILFYENEQTDERSVRVLENYQNGALQFVRKFKKFRHMFHLSAGFSIDALNKQFTLPQKKDIKEWEGIIFKEMNDRALICSHGYRYYLIHPFEILSDYRKSIWKSGYLKKIFRINLHRFIIHKIW